MEIYCRDTAITSDDFIFFIARKKKRKIEMKEDGCFGSVHSMTSNMALSFGITFANGSIWLSVTLKTGLIKKTISYFPKQNLKANTTGKVNGWNQSVYVSM